VASQIRWYKCSHNPTNKQPHRLHRSSSAHPCHSIPTIPAPLHRPSWQRTGRTVSACTNIGRRRRRPKEYVHRVPYRVLFVMDDSLKGRWLHVAVFMIWCRTEWDRRVEWISVTTSPKAQGEPAEDAVSVVPVYCEYRILFWVLLTVFCSMPAGGVFQTGIVTA